MAAVFLVHSCYQSLVWLLQQRSNAVGVAIAFNLVGTIELVLDIAMIPPAIHQFLLVCIYYNNSFGVLQSFGVIEVPPPPRHQSQNG